MTPNVKASPNLSQIENLLIHESLSPTVLVNQQGEILHIHGRTGAYLEPSSGQPSNNIFTMGREGLQLELASAVRKAVTDNTIVVRRDVRVKTNGSYEWVNLVVKKIHDPETFRGLILVRFEPVPPPSAEGAGGADVIAGNSELERELRHAREHLQSTIEELEASNEELKSANEELQSTNEELQSTNEELETTKEETQSLNEELQTVNAELQSKIEELSQASDDLTNLLNSTDIATLFLDEELNIKRFTKQARRIIHLIPSDIGRPVGDIVARVKNVSLGEQAQEVLDSLVPVQSEVQMDDGTWYLMRTAPYRSSDDLVAGVVITFVNTSELMAARKLAESADLASRIVESMIDPVVVLGADLKIVSTNSAFNRIFSQKAADVMNKSILDIFDGDSKRHELQRALEDVLKRRQGFENFRLTQKSGPTGARELSLYARQLEKGDQKSEMILLVVNEVNSKG